MLRRAVSRDGARVTYMKAVPMVCPVCRERGSYYGRLVFPEEFDMADPICPNHPKGHEPRMVLPRRTTDRAFAK